MKSLLNYFVRSIRYRREKKIRCLSDQEKVRVMKSTIERVRRIENELATQKGLLFKINTDGVILRILTPAERGFDYIDINDMFVSDIIKKSVEARINQLNSMLNEILIKEYDRKDNKAADC